MINIVLNRSLIYYGNLEPAVGGVIALATVGVVLKLNMIIMSICIGIGIGFQPIISFNMAAKQYNRVNETFIKSIILAFIVTASGWLIIQIFPDFIIGIFGNSNPVFYNFGIKVIRIMLAFLFLVGMQVIGTLYLQATGLPLVSSCISFTRQVIIIIPLILILPKFLGLTGILMSAPIADIIAFIITFIIVKKVYKKRNE